MALPLMLISCEDILGEWSRPTPTPEEILTNLSAALEEGAVVTITYTIDGVTYTSTFKKVGDEYVEQSTTTAGARAMTRMSMAEMIVSLGFLPQNALDFEVRKNNEVVLNTQINTDNGDYTTIFADPGAAFEGMTLNNKKTYTTTIYKEEATILLSAADVVGTIKYKEGESWREVYQRQTKSGKMMLQVDTKNKQVLYTCNGHSGVLYYDEAHTNPVRPADAVGKDGVVSYYLAVVPLSYREFTLNDAGTAIDDVSPDRTTSTYTFLTSSAVGAKLQAGTYVVPTNITIDGDIILKGDVKLVLCDGVTMKLTGGIYCAKHNLTICGQEENTGKLAITGNDSYGMYNSPKLTIHGGDIQIKNQDIHDGIYHANLYVLGGKLSSMASEAFAIQTGADGSTPCEMKVYGGEVEAIVTNSTKHAGIMIGTSGTLGTLTVYGGKVTASSPAQAIKGSFVAGEGSAIGFFGRDATDADWESITGSTTDYKYFYADVEAPIVSSGD